jgi:hypothetical protein
MYLLLCSAASPPQGSDDDVEIYRHKAGREGVTGTVETFILGRRKSVWLLFGCE